MHHLMLLAVHYYSSFIDLRTEIQEYAIICSICYNCYFSDSNLIVLPCPNYLTLRIFTYRYLGCFVHRINYENSLHQIISKKKISPTI